MIQQQTIEEIKQTDLVSLVGDYTKLRRTGSEFVGLCPFHDEKTPSFYVSRRGFKCFGCDARGSNVIDFIMKIENIGFKEAVEKLGLPVTTVTHRNTVTPVTVRYNVRTCEFLPSEPIIKSLEARGQNNLYKYFSKLFTKRGTEIICSMYGIGGARGDYTAFIQTDEQQRIRQVKLMLYDPITGKRNKDIAPRYIGKQLLNNPNAHLQQCLFGQHLAKDCSKPIAIVESEKTAAGMSIVAPKFLWLATGGKNGCNLNTAEILKGKDVTLFPDNDGVPTWKQTASANGWKINTIMAEAAPKGSKEDIWDLATRRVDSTGLVLDTKFDYPLIFDL